MTRLVLAKLSRLKLRFRSGPPTLWQKSQLIPAVESDGFEPAGGGPPIVSGSTCFPVTLSTKW